MKNIEKHCHASVVQLPWYSPRPSLRGDAEMAKGLSRKMGDKARVVTPISLRYPRRRLSYTLLDILSIRHILVIIDFYIWIT